LFTPLLPALESDLRCVPPIAKHWPGVLVTAGAALLCAAPPAVAQDRPREQIGPFFDIDWNVGLRGTYTADRASGASYEGTIAPDVTFTRQGERDQTSLDVGAEFGVKLDKTIRLEDVHVDAASSYRLDEVTQLDGSLKLRLSQDVAGNPSLPSATKVPPLQFTGTAEGKVTRNFGRVDVVGSLSGERFLDGQTVLNDGTVLSNVDKNFWRGAGDLRLGYELTPVMSVFAEGSAGIQKYDTASPSLLKFLDNRAYSLRGGLSYTLPGTRDAETSVGRTWLDYTVPSIADTAGWLYTAKASVTPGETTTFSAALDTSLMPSDVVQGDTDLGYTLTGSALYQVNPWLTLRGTASANRTVTLASGDSDWGYGLGAGFDLASSRHVVWSADYLFTHDDSSVDGITDTHAVTLGVKIKK